jgi:glycine cleavage system H protein
VAVNSALESSPELVNSDPYGAGWMLKLKASDPAEVEKLMDRQSYLSTLQK